MHLYDCVKEILLFLFMTTVESYTILLKQKMTMVSFCFEKIRDPVVVLFIGKTLYKECAQGLRVPRVSYSEIKSNQNELQTDFLLILNPLVVRSRLSMSMNSISLL